MRQVTSGLNDGFAASNPDLLEHMKLYIVYDAYVSDAIAIVFQDICGGKTALWDSCTYKMGQVSDVIITYVDMMVTNPNLKYYYDEYQDRTDPYRASLIEKISNKSGQPTYIVKAIMNALYWATKDRRIASNVVLKPREKGFTGDSGRSGIAGPLVKSGEKIIDGAGKIIAGAADGLQSTGKTVGAILSYMPWLLGIVGVGYAVVMIDKAGLLTKMMKGKRK